MKRNKAYSTRMMLALLLVLSLALSACGNGNSGGGNEPAAGTNTPPATQGGEEKKDPVTITMWDKAGGMADAINERVEKFNSERDDIQINFIQQGSDGFEDNLRLAFQSKQGPDIFPASPTIALYKAGFLQPLEDVLDPQILEDFAAFGKNGLTVFEGKTYAVPINAVTVRLVYNKDLFREAGLDPEQPPTTFSEFVDYARIISEKGAGEYFGVGLPLKWNGFMDWHLDPLVLSTDMELTKKGLFNLRTQQFETIKYKPVIEMLREIVSNNWAYPGASTLDNDPMRSAFAEGKIGMFIGASWDVGTLNEQFNTTVDWSAAPIPVPDGEQALRHISNAGKNWALSADTKHPEEAAEVLEYLVGAETSQELQKKGLLNALNPAANDEQYMPEGVEQFKHFVPGELDQQFPADPTSLLKIQGNNYSSAVMELILTNKEIDPVLENLAKVYTDAYTKLVQSGEIDPSHYSMAE
ncbi:ABC transporter substrate-binding protein [Paenibacillus sp. 1P07SE]|uniref:ABC transporter substrate-binding protein n=1 Tax=Paenibacillus sp. 1P07SE TaxID=3132209 RepID=UPI0039A46BF4